MKSRFLSALNSEWSNDFSEHWLWSEITISLGTYSKSCPEHNSMDGSPGSWLLRARKVAHKEILEFTTLTSAHTRARSSVHLEQGCLQPYANESTCEYAALSKQILLRKMHSTLWNESEVDWWTSTLLLCCCAASFQSVALASHLSGIATTKFIHHPSLSHINQRQTNMRNASSIIRHRAKWSRVKPITAICHAPSVKLLSQDNQSQSDQH